MQLAKYQTSSGQTCVGLVDGNQLWPLRLDGSQHRTLSDILEAEQPSQAAESLVDRDGGPVPRAKVALLAPIDGQEVWAAGVTYKRSRSARMEESDAAAACYDRVYESARPELFLKATPHRVSGPGQALAIRSDSHWNVPEPELTLVLDSQLALVGCTVGNDMSSRDIEGDNPLYLPQAKVYDACCGLGPVITLIESMPPADQIGIALVVRRGSQPVFEGSARVSQMARSFDELIEWLGRDNSFPNGVMLMTGTGVVPDRQFSLQPGDTVDITIDGIGTLSNPVIRAGVH